MKLPKHFLLSVFCGSGKSAMTKSADDGGLGLIDRDKFIVLDADAIKEMLPEYEGWNAWQVHEESGQLFDEITKYAKSLGLNICHDATMKTPEKAVALVDNFNSAGYATEAHYMHLPRQEAAKRAVGRFLGKTGRYVPVDVILGNTKNEGAFDQIKSKVGKWSFHDNNVEEGQKPILISRSGEEKTMTKAIKQSMIIFWRKK
jgi:predicted ABC-type ATPase